MTTARKERIIRNKFRKNSNVTKVTFIYSTLMSEIQVKVRYQTSLQFERVREFIEGVADDLGFELRNITYTEMSKNYEYSTFHLKLI